MDATTAAVIAAIVGPLFTYLIAVRRLSGRIDTTEAQDLWKEAGRLREWSAEQIKRLEKRVDLLEVANSKLTDELIAARRRVAELEGHPA